jgi:hypothetical protein
MSFKSAVAARDIMFVVSDFAAFATFFHSTSTGKLVFLKNGYRLQIGLCIGWYSVHYFIKAWAGYDE